MSSKRNRSVTFTSHSIITWLLREPQQDFEKTFVNKGELDG